MQDIINVNNKIGLPLLALVGAETFINNSPLEAAIPLALFHAVLVYANTVAAVKEAKNKRQWFPTVLFRNILVVTIVCSGIAVLFDILLAAVTAISGIAVYVLLGVTGGSTAKTPGNRPRINEEPDTREIIRYSNNRGFTGPKMHSGKNRRNRTDVVEVEIVD